jgi:hypothetical protein
LNQSKLKIKDSVKKPSGSSKIQVPTYTQTPNELFDNWLPLLGEIELKVLLIIIRRTFGWYKSREKIIVPHIQKIIGFSEIEIINAITNLRQKGVIRKKIEMELRKGSAHYELKELAYYELVFDISSNYYSPCSNKETKFDLRNKKNINNQDKEKTNASSKNKNETKEDLP